MLAVVGISVGVAKGYDFLFFFVTISFAAVHVQPKDLVLLFIANVEKTRWIPNWSFGKTEAPSNPRQLRLTVEQLPKLRGFGPQFELS
jgi:hypothetical protein